MPLVVSQQGWAWAGPGNLTQSTGASATEGMVSLLRAHAPRQIYWDPRHVRAAVVTCGGLCPGLNSIIRGITKCLLREYQIVGPIVSFTAGYNGLSDPVAHPPVEMTNESVRDIHLRGGSIIKVCL